MVSNSSVAGLARISHLTFRNASRPTSLLRVSRAFSTSQRLSEPAPLMVQIKTDLKAAMRAKDAPRLSVLRSVLAASNDAAKQDKEIKTDEQVIELLMKTASGIEQAVEEAKKANRPDLVQKEEAQMQVVDEYVAKSGIVVMSEEEITAILEARLAELGAAEKLGTSTRNTLSAELNKGALVPPGKYLSKRKAFLILNELVKKQ